MELNAKVVDNVAIVELSGRFDAYEAPAFSDWLNKNLQSGRTHVLVDLGGVGFIDSTALATLVQGMKRCREKDGDLSLCRLQQTVRIIFELTRLDKAFSVFESQATAMAAFAS